MQAPSPNYASSGELKRDGSELYTRHSGTDSCVIHGLRKVQRLDADKRTSLDKDIDKAERRSYTPNNHEQQLRRCNDGEKENIHDQEKQQYSKLSSKDYYKQVPHSPQ